MEDVSAGVLPDLAAFLPLWVKRLQRFRPAKDEWETEHERWLREAVFRADGVGGSRAHCAKDEAARACLAWYEALAERGDWTAALAASTRRRGWCASRTGGANSSTGPHSPLRSLAGPICPGGWKPRGAPLPR